MRIGERIKRMERLDVNKILDETIKEIETFIIELNQDQLYDRGEINVNNPAQRERYAPGTIRQKRKTATYKKTDFVTLRWDGDLYDAMKVYCFREYFIITSRDLKWVWHEKNPRFKNALGLTDESKARLRDELRPLIIKKIKSMI
jgi:hypothetical protein